jgi:hypothetical protein
MIAAGDASEIDIFLKYGIFTMILLQYGWDLFNHSLRGFLSVQDLIVYIMRR